MIRLKHKGIRNPHEKIDIVHKTKVISTSRTTRLVRKTKAMGLYPPQACEKIKDIHQGYKCIFNLVARDKEAIHMNRNNKPKKGLKQ